MICSEKQNVGLVGRERKVCMHASLMSVDPGISRISRLTTNPYVPLSNQPTLIGASVGENQLMASRLPDFQYPSRILDIRFYVTGCGLVICTSPTRY